MAKHGKSEGAPVIRPVIQTGQPTVAEQVELAEKAILFDRQWDETTARNESKGGRS